MTALLILAFFGLFIRKVLAARRRPVFEGAESIVGSVGEAREDLAPRV